MKSEHILFFLCGTFLLFLFRFFHLRFRKKNTLLKKKKIAAVTVAGLDLKLARAQMSKSAFYEFSKLLSDALRTYVLARYKVRAFNVTSEELFNKLLANSSNELYIISLLVEVLKITDSVKYSSRTLSIPQQKGIYKKACSFVLLSERFFRKKSRADS